MLTASQAVLLYIKVESLIKSLFLFVSSGTTVLYVCLTRLERMRLPYFGNGVIFERWLLAIASLAAKSCNVAFRWRGIARPYFHAVGLLAPGVSSGNSDITIVRWWRATGCLAESMIRTVLLGPVLAGTAPGGRCSF
jgi:hypothetical protein